MNTTPTVAGFTTFVESVMGCPTADIPSSDQLQQALDYAAQWVPDFLSTLAGGPALSANTNNYYVDTVYNWAGSLLIQFQPDASGQTFWSKARTTFAVTNWVPGAIQSTSDEGTSQAMALGDGMKNLGFAEMQRAKDPYGRHCMEILQSIGPLWGLT
jgi:hypothetical protein